MNRFFFLFCCVFLTGCDDGLLLENFIPEPVDSATETVQDTKIFYTSFPQKCEWMSLQRVVDGDTIIVEKDIRVRLIGIDTPETKREGYPIEKGGLEASQFAKDFLADAQEVCLIEDTIGDTYDKYGRKLAYVFRRDGSDLNAESLKSGFARGYFGFQFDRKEEFEQYEKQAKAKEVNLWE